MPDERCRVTVVGERRRVDLALPARAPIAEYAPRLATLCGQSEPEAKPPVWSLAEPGAEPLAPGESLAEAGILDGATLYLHDHRAGELGELTVTDLDDQVADARDDKTLWDGRRRAQSVLGAGLLVMVVSAAWLGAHRLAALAAVLFALAALTVPLLAWYAQRKNWPLPSAVRQLLALAAGPLMACVGLCSPIQGPTATPVLVAVTAVVGALLGLVALPAPSTAVLLALTALAALFVLPLTVFGAGTTGAAAVVAMVLFLLATLLPRVTSQIAVLVPSGPDTGAPLIDNDDVAAVVRRGNGLLTLLSVVTGTALAVSLVVLSSSRGGAGLALAAVVSIGLLLQAGTVRVLTAVVPQLAAGVVGLLALVIRVPEYLFGSPAFGPLAAFGGGAVLVVCGLFLAFSAALRPIEPERPTWPGAVTTLLTVASLPLTAAVFGLFGWLANLGGGL